jgi:hypothetical protein
MPEEVFLELQAAAAAVTMVDDVVVVCMCILPVLVLS